MKNKIHNIFRKLLFSFLKFIGAAAFLGCDQSIIINHEFYSPYVMYGMPGNTIVVTGTVYGDIDKDGTKEIIPGVKVSIEPIVTDNNSNEQNESVIADEDEIDDFNPSIQVADSSGNFEVEYYDYSESDFKYKITFKDIDGPENGLFKDKSITLNFSSEEERSKNATWGITIEKDLGDVDLENNE